MPFISQFLGIVIYMYYSEHNPPHFHAVYGEYEGLFSFDGEILNGNMPLKQSKLIAAWALLHQQELQDNWVCASEHKALTSIRGLR